MDLLNDASLTIARLAPLIRRRKISPVELTDAFLGRIARLQPALNAFITVTAETARKQAMRAEREISKGRYRGPLHGIPLTLKDLFYTPGSGPREARRSCAALSPRRTPSWWTASLPPVPFYWERPTSTNLHTG